MGAGTALPGSDCYALLDDASGGEGSRSRLYTGLVRALRCDSLEAWPGVLADMQAALDSGQFAVPVLTYELGCALHGIACEAPAVPLAQVLLFSSCERMAPDQVAGWLATRADHGSPAGVGGLRASVDEAAFTDAIHRIREYIAAGDTYQVNYTYRLRFDAYGSVASLYARLRERQPVPYGALIQLPDGSAVVSLSPELFVRSEGGNLVTRPMKGTAPASGDAATDALRAADLAADTKNRAENLMIVDLLRNDVGRVCETGSVKVPSLFEVTRFGSVLQMTSTVTGRLRDGTTLAALFDALYPCGSITGAPKRRTMEIIAEVERGPRGIYTGAIGWFDPPTLPGRIGDFCLSVPIRTLTLGPEQDGVRRGELGVGAGIVYDSEAASEYAECQLKARFLTGMGSQFDLFETMRADAGGVRHLERHLSRMGASAAWFGIAFDQGRARSEIAQACSTLEGPTRMRLTLRPDGQMALQCAPLAPLATPVGLLVADRPVRSGDLFLRHKTSVRARYDAAWREAESRSAFDTLFFNERGELTEGGRSNVFVKVDGRWLTPPLRAGLLPGVMRSVLLEDPQWDAVEAVVTREMLARATDIVVCNALRGALPARILGPARAEA